MNEISKSDVYADAGVDITAGYKAVELMKSTSRARSPRASALMSAASAVCSN